MDKGSQIFTSIVTVYLVPADISIVRTLTASYKVHSGSVSDNIPSLTPLFSLNPLLNPHNNPLERNFSN